MPRFFYFICNAYHSLDDNLIARFAKGGHLVCVTIICITKRNLLKKYIHNLAKNIFGKEFGLKVTLPEDFLKQLNHKESCQRQVRLWQLAST